MAETRKVFPPSLALLNLGNKKLYLQNLVLRDLGVRLRLFAGRKLDKVGTLFDKVHRAI